MSAWLAATMLILAACGSATSGSGASTSTAAKSGSSNSAATASAASGAQQTVTVALGTDALTLVPNTIVDETTHVQLQNIFDPLITRDPKTAQLVPALATSWKYTNPTTLVLTLRKGVTFQNGEPFSAKDVIFTLQYIQNPANKSEYLTRYSLVTGITAPNAYTVEFHTKAPFPELVDRLANFLVMPATYFKKVGTSGFRAHPIGTGPYEFVSFTPDQQLALKAYPKYWRGAPDIGNVVFKYVPEFSSRLAGLLAGDYDLVKDIPPRAIAQVNSSGVAKVEEITSSRVDYIALVNYRAGPMQNQKVRQAMNYAVNVPLLIKSVLAGHATQDAGSIPTTSSCQDTALQPYSYNPQKAIKLIQQAGYKPSQLSFTLDTPSGRYPKDKQVAEAIAAELGQIGIKVNVRVNAWGPYLDRISGHKTGAMFLLGWGPNFDPQNIIQPLFEKGWTYSSFTDPSLAKLITQASETVNPTQACKEWTKIQQIVYQQAPWIFLWQQHDIYGVSKKIAWQPRSDEENWMYEAKWVGGK